MPFFHGKKLVSLYEFLEERFDYRVRALASGLFLAWRFFWMATALYASAQIMSRLTGVSLPAVILAGGVVATVYTAVGGMRAVMWTDVLQFFVLFGGLSFDPRIRMTLWSGLIGVTVAFLARYGADQMVVQRYFTARDLRAAQRGLWLNAFVSVLSLSLLVLFGLAVYVHAVKSGALAGTRIMNGTALQQIAALIRSFPSGVTGVIAAALLAATMSSIDSGINSCGAAYLTDFHNRLFRFRLPGHLLTAVIGSAVTFLALTAVPLAGRTNTLFMIVNKFVNGLGSPLLTLVALAMFSKRVNTFGMLAGGLCGVAASLAISFCVRNLALQYYAVANLILTITFCYLFSFASERLAAAKR